MWSGPRSFLDSLDLPPWLGLLLTPAVGFLGARLNFRAAARQSAAEKFLEAVQEELGQVRTLLAATAARLDEKDHQMVEKDHQVDELRRAVVACQDDRVTSAIQLRLAQERIGVLVAANEAMVLRLLELEGRVDNKAEKPIAPAATAPTGEDRRSSGGAP